MIARELTDQERALWSKYFQCKSMLAIADEFNAKTWPVDTSTVIDRAQYIGTFCYVFEKLRASFKTKTEVAE